MLDKKTKMKRLKVAREILAGNLFLEEAMDQCQIKNRNVMIGWLKRAQQLEESENTTFLIECSIELKSGSGESTLSCDRETKEI